MLQSIIMYGLVWYGMVSVSVWYGMVWHGKGMDIRMAKVVLYLKANKVWFVVVLAITSAHIQLISFSTQLPIDDGVNISHADL